MKKNTKPAELVRIAASHNSNNMNMVSVKMPVLSDDKLKELAKNIFKLN